MSSGFFSRRQFRPTIKMFYNFQASVRLRQSPTCCRAVQRPHEPPSFGLAQNRDPDDQDEGRDEGEDRHEARVLLPHHRRVHHPAGIKFNDLTKYVMPWGRSNQVVLGAAFERENK